MRIKLTHLIIVSFISLSVVFSAISNADAARQKTTVKQYRTTFAYGIGGTAGNAPGNGRYEPNYPLNFYFITKGRPSGTTHMEYGAESWNALLVGGGPSSSKFVYLYISHPDLVEFGSGVYTFNNPWRRGGNYSFTIIPKGSTTKKISFGIIRTPEYHTNVKVTAISGRERKEIVIWMQGRYGEE